MESEIAFAVISGSGETMIVSAVMSGSGETMPPSCCRTASNKERYCSESPFKTNGNLNCRFKLPRPVGKAKHSKVVRGCLMDGCKFGQIH